MRQILLLLFLCTLLPNKSHQAAPKNVAEASLSKMGNSALVDKETGQVYWHSGSRAQIPQLWDMKHVKSAVLTVLLYSSALSAFLGSILKDKTSRNVIMVVLSILYKIIPSFSPGFVLAMLLLYLLEAWNSSTRRYLDNIATPREVEEHIEKLRLTPPSVTWTVRCYHYEHRLRGLNDKESSNTMGSSKKVVTHTASKEYQFGSWKDNTVMGVWERAKASTIISPFTKISFTKMLVLSDTKAREDYFSQQANFVSTEGHWDDHAEFSTTINVDGFEPKMLAVRTIIGAPGTGLVKKEMFWFFTLIGLTVPYRIWFSRHCDEICVTMVKETTAAGVFPRKPLLPKLWSSRKDEMEEDSFIRNMKDFNFYNEAEEVAVEDNIAQVAESVVEEVTPSEISVATSSTDGEEPVETTDTKNEDDTSAEEVVVEDLAEEAAKE